MPKPNTILFVSEQKAKYETRPTTHRRRRGKHTQRHPQPEDDAPALLASPPSRAIAPYAPSSEAADRKLQFLIHHYCTVVVAESVTSVGPRYEWFPFCLRSKSFFHAVMSSTSSHAAYLQQVDLPRDFFYHRGEAIRLLNSQIAEGAHDEGTINTVAVFSQQESFEGRAEGTRIHLNGLLHLVRAAGGLQSPALSQKTRRYLLHTDQAACIVLNTKQFLPPTLVDDLQTYFGPASPITQEFANAFKVRLLNYSSDNLDDHQAEVVQELCDQAGKVYWGLRNLAASLRAVHAGKEIVDTPSPEDIQFSDRVEVLERAVHPLWFQEEHLMFRVFGWTCLIYIYTILRELPYQLGMNSMLASRIKSGLEKRADLNVLLATFQDLFLWQMFLCGKVADPRDKSFFAKQATRILMIRKIESQEDILAASEGFLWPEKDAGYSPDTLDDSSEYGTALNGSEEGSSGIEGALHVRGQGSANRE